MPVSTPVTTRRRPIAVTSSRTAPAEWLDDEVVLLSGGQTLTLPVSAGRITIKVLGAGAFVTSAAEVETGEVSGGAVVTSAAPVPLLCVGEAVLLTSAGGPWYRV